MYAVGFRCLRRFSVGNPRQSLTWAVKERAEWAWHYLGSACTDEFKAVQQENMELKQQLELMKMCGKVNKNPTLSNNPNFKLLVSKCSGIIIPDDKIIKPEGSYWDSIKDNYKKENPDVKLMGDKFIGPKDEQ